MQGGWPTIGDRNHFSKRSRSPLKKPKLPVKCELSSSTVYEAATNNDYDDNKKTKANCEGADNDDDYGDYDGIIRRRLIEKALIKTNRYSPDLHGCRILIEAIQ